jgi:hypothetical protein
MAPTPLFQHITATAHFQREMTDKSILEKGAVLSLALHFHPQTNPLQEVDVRSILDSCFPQVSFDALNWVVRHVSGVFADLRLHSPCFEAQKAALVDKMVTFSELRRFLQQPAFASFPSCLLEKVWASHLFVLRKHRNKDPNFAADLLHTLLVIAINSELPNSQTLEITDPLFYSLLGYSLTKETFSDLRQCIHRYIQDFGNPFYSRDKYKALYLKELGKSDFDFSVLLGHGSLGGVVGGLPLHVLTPVIVESVLHRKSPVILNGVPFKIQHLTIKAEFKSSVAFADSPESTLETFSIKQALRCTSDMENLAGSYQWLKGLLLACDLRPLTSQGFPTIHVCPSLAPLVTSLSTIHNFHKCWRIAHESFQLEYPIQFYQFFVAVLEKLIRQRPKGKTFSTDNILKHSKFMKSLVGCLHFLYSQITGTTPLSIPKLAGYCEVSVVDLWKAVTQFLSHFGPELPVALRKACLAFEFEILLRQLWVRTETENTPASDLFLSCNGHANHILRRLHKVVAERLFLMGHELGLEGDQLDAAWSQLKRLLVLGFEYGPKFTDTSFKENIHIDLLILAVLKTTEDLSTLSLTEFLQVYEKKVLFPVPDVLAGFSSYLERFPDISRKNSSLRSDTSEHSKDSSQPFKDSVPDYLESELAAQIPITPIRKSFNLREMASPGQRRLFFSSIEVPRIQGRKMVKESLPDRVSAKEVTIAEPGPAVNLTLLLKSTDISQESSAFFTGGLGKVSEDLPTSNTSKIDLQISK